MKAAMIAAAMLLLVAGTAQAHTKLKKSTPADNAVLSEAPQQLSLEFSKVARLTALSLQREGEKEPAKVTALPKSLATIQTVPLRALVPGKYLVNWRVVSEDNHVMSGKLQFTVKTTAQ